LDYIWQPISRTKDRALRDWEYRNVGILSLGGFLKKIVVYVHC
jgi:hypothetical protein